MKSQLVTALAVSTGNILGPLVVFGGIGWALTQHYGSNKYVIIGIFVAFITSNLLVITTTSKLVRWLKRQPTATDDAPKNPTDQA